jgi:hypothetical protein
MSARVRPIPPRDLVALKRLKRQATGLTPGSLARRLILEESDAVDPAAWIVASQILLRAVVLEEEAARAARRAGRVLPVVARSIADSAERAREMAA